ncbi:MAG TPA: ATP-binding protein, partial [Polyangia bacterium]|nr:ATP-binding protein [Polyangia bacterium]
AIGRLAGGIAHDFNNLLSVIISSTVMLSADQLEERTAREVDEIRQAGERAADLTRQLLAFSRQQVRAPKVLDLNDAIVRMDGMLRRMIGEDIDLGTALAPGLDAVRADACQIEQVIMNLVVNARDAMPDGGRLQIETANVDVDEPFARAHLGLTPGRHVMLAVMDSGPGIDPAIQDKIFEPFFTTKEHGKGTGLGLATVFGIVRQSGGGVFVESRPGQGATFRCYFPYTDAVPVRPVTQPAPPSGGGGGGNGGETVLLVEDDAQVRRVVGRILRQEGYDVVEAGLPSEALRMEAHLPRSPHLIITDLVMPEMNGRQLADRLRSLHPSAEVLYMSGYTDHLLERDGILEDGLHFLPKPIIPAVLIEAVHAVLRGRSANQRTGSART